MALIPAFSGYAATRFRKRTGEPLKHRAVLNIIKRYRLPVVYCGGEPLIDDVEADEILKRNAKWQPEVADPQPRRRGRPRTIVGG